MFWSVTLISLHDSGVRQVLSRSAATSWLANRGRAPRRAAPISVSGGRMVSSSAPNTRKGVGCGACASPSDWPRTGSRSVAIQPATSSPGNPSARNATCQPCRCHAPPSGWARFHACTIAPPMNSDTPPPTYSPAE